MPDAHGNLLGIHEFTDGRKIRLHSGLGGGDLVFWFGMEEWPKLHSLNDGEARPDTVLTIEARPENGAFRLFQRDRMGDHALRLIWRDNMIGREYDDRYQPDHKDQFTVDMLDGGCWFALNNLMRSRVFDVEYGEARAGARIIAWEWNGGANQRWRAQIVE